MDNQNNQQRPGHMPRLSYGQRFWRIWGPFIIEWGIQIVVSMAAAVVVMYQYMNAHTKEVVAAYENQAAMMQFATKLMNMMQKYTTIISGATALVVIPVMLFLYHRDRNREKYYGVATNKKAPLWKYVLVVVFAGGASLALNNLILIGNLSALSATYETTATSMYSAPFAVQIVCLAILSPIAEELVFRGLMFRRMREDTGAKLAIIYTSVVFGIFHGNFVQMLYGFLMGLMFAWLCEKYGSVLAPIVAHVTANLLALFATKYQIFDRMMADIRVIGMVTVGAATIAAIIYLQIKQIDEKPTGYSENKEIS